MSGARSKSEFPLNAAVKPLTPSIDFDLRVLAYVGYLRAILDQAALSQWRGIYFIFDENDSKGYVGSAYGTENIPGRWLSYAAGGHGGNKELRKRDPTHFRFSIPQRVSPDMEPAEIIWLESGWKDRLHTREFRMNEN